MFTPIEIATAIILVALVFAISFLVGWFAKSSDAVSLTSVGLVVTVIVFVPSITIPFLCIFATVGYTVFIAEIIMNFVSPE